MFQRWFYTHDGKTHGPMAIAEAVRRAAAGELHANDRLWPEDFDPQMAFPASSTIDFSGLNQPAPPPPAAKPAPPPPAAGVPDWLSDVAEVEKRPLDRPSPAPAPAAPAASLGLPDWLSDVDVTDRFIVRGPPPNLAPAMPAPPPPVPSARPVQTRTAPVSPPPPSAPAAPAGPAAPARVAPRTTFPPTSAPAAPAAPVPPARRPATAFAAPTPPATAVPPSASPPTGKPDPAETGFDADTGQVLDADKYRRWQKRQKEVKTETAAAGETVYEVFLRANRALQDWIDQETNRPLLAQGISAVRADVGVQSLIASFAMWGQDFTNKLWQRLEFLVGNRAEFYASRA